MRSKFLLPLVLLAAACDRGPTVTAPQANYARTPMAPALLVVSSAAQFAAPLGLTGCWGGDGNANDVVLGNNGNILGAVSFAPGRFGQAFSFDALGGDVLVAPTPTLDVMQGDGITLAAWFLPKGQAFGTVAGSGPILEYNNGAQIWVHSQISPTPFTSFFANMSESDLQHGWHIVEAPGVITQNAWNFGVASYSKTSGNITTYVNGVQVGQAHVGVISPMTATAFHIGSREPGSFGATRYTFNGLIDDAQVYNRELTSGEVLQIAGASSSVCAAPAQLGVLTQPAGYQSGVPFSTQPAIEVRDASGVRVSFARTAVTVSIGSGTGTLQGTTSVSAVNGIATFTNLAVTGATVGTTLRFTAPGLLPVSSNSLVAGPSYSFQGFFGDLDAAPKLNKVKAGKKVNVEFSLGGNQGFAIFAAGFPATRLISCTSLSSLGPLVPLVKSGDDEDDDHENNGNNGNNGDNEDGNDGNNKAGFSLAYRRQNTHYTLRWRTDKSFDGTCRALVLTFADGSSRTAYFSFTK